MRGGVVIYTGQEYRVFGGGQTTSQLARAFRRRDYDVLLVPLMQYAHSGGYTGRPLERGMEEVPLERSWPAVQRFLIEHPEAIWLCSLPTSEALRHLDMIDGLVATVYHVRDDWREFREYWWYPDVEAETVDRVDHVTAITPAYSGLGGRDVTVVPNAHDPALWRFRPRPRTPWDAATVIYWGSFPGGTFWRDDVFRGVVERLPSWRFVLVGGYQDYWPIETLPENVECLGWLQVDEISDCADSADLGLIPFGWPVSERCDPIKAHEMVAAGLPFVACGCPAVELLGLPECRHVAADAEAVAQALVGLAHADHNVEAQRSYAAADTWDRRVEQFEKLCGM